VTTYKRKIGGRWYYFHNEDKTKAMARERAKDLRHIGYRVRVIFMSERSNPWTIWTSPMWKGKIRSH